MKKTACQVMLTCLATLGAAVGLRGEAISLPTSVKADPLPEARRQYADGLALSIAARGAADASSVDTRPVRFASLFVPEGEVPSAFVAAGPFRATWHGYIKAPLRGQYQFSAGGRGRYTLSINGTQVLACEGDDFAKTPAVLVELNKGRNELIATYDSPTEGDAFVRLYWQAGDFARETIPPDVFSHDASENTLRDGVRHRLGRELIAMRRCTHCHAVDVATKAMLKMPELDADAPSFDGIGSRVSAPWIAAWLVDPTALRPSATMPSMLDHFGDDRAARAADIAAFLSSLIADKAGEPAMPATDAAAIKAGGDHFARLGCIGCHALPDHEDASTLEGRVPLAFVKAKFQPQALVAFLLKPDAHYRSVRMPDFHLSPEESKQIAGFLLSFKGQAIDDGPEVSKGDAARGRELVTSAGCLNCHTVQAAPTLTNQYQAPTLATILQRDWQSGCLVDEQANATASKAPRFHFDEVARDALRAFASTDWSSLGRVSRAEFAQRQIKALRCDACHERDGITSWWEEFQNEVAPLKVERAKSAGNAEDDPFGTGDPAAGGAPPVDQSRPRLTLIGEKLKPQWTTAILTGKLDYKPRPWMDARMPSFHERGKMIAEGLAMEHGFPPVAPPEPAPDAKMVEIGRKLVAQQGGFACNGCHGIGAVKPFNVFEAQGVNFMYTGERLTNEYFHRWTRKPIRISPQTRMPQFANDEGKTPLTEYYDGDAHQQFEAIWQYLLTGRKIEAPK